MPNYNISQSNNYIIYTDQTGSTIYDSGGPSGQYSDSENIFFLIAPAYSTGTLTLNITSFASETSYDYLRIYDRYVPTASFSYGGNNPGTPASLLAVVNGSPSLPITVTSSTGRAYLRWSSDSSVVGNGFGLSWTGSGFYNVDSSSGVVLNQYAATFPRTASSSSYITIPKTLFSGSNTVLSGSKDILIGFWAKFDNGMQTSANSLGILSIGGTNVPAGGSNLTVQRAGSTDNLRIYITDVSGGFTSTATDMVMGGGTTTAATYPPQWHHYGIALRKTSTTSSAVTFYRNGEVYTTNTHTRATAFSTIQAIDDPVIGNFRDYTTMVGVIQSAGGWSGSLDDVFLATITTGSTQAEYNTFFSNIYNSGNFSQPTSVITASLSSSLNPSVIFNLRFEETGGLLNLKDYGSFGNFHTATSTASAPVAPYLTTTSSGISYTPYSSLAYSASVPAGVPSFSFPTYTYGESAGIIYIEVSRLSGNVGPLSVDYTTVDGTALSGTNYTKTTGTFTWEDGNDYTSYNVEVPILYDGIEAPTKNFSIKLSNLSVGSFSSFPNAITSSTINIYDEEPGTFKLSSSSYSVTEGESATITVQRYSGSYGSVVVNVQTVDGDAEAGIDYNLVNLNLTFTDGQTSRTYNIQTINNDVNIAGAKSFQTYINSVNSIDAGTAFIGSPFIATVDILDNESGSIRFTSSSYTVSQGSSITFYVERYGGFDFPATASITVSGSSTAVAGVDYTNIFPYTVSWNNQESGSKSITLNTITNEWNPSKTLNLNIGSLTNITSGTIMSSSILIQSNVLTQSSNQYSQYSTDFTINKYLNLSSEFTRRTQQVPFSLGTNPLIRLKQAYSAST